MEGYRVARDNLDDAKIIHERGVAYSLLPINQSDTSQLKEPVSSCMRKRVDGAFIQNALTWWRRLNRCGWLASHTAEKACEGLRLFWLVSLNKVNCKTFYVCYFVSFHRRFFQWKNVFKLLQILCVRQTVTGQLTCLSGTRGAKQEVVEWTQRIFSAPSSSIFFSTASRSVLNSSPSRTFSMTTGWNPA